jgi:hypothetical protein
MKKGCLICLYSILVLFPFLWPACTGHAQQSDQDIIKAINQHMPNTALPCLCQG